MRKSIAKEKELNVEVSIEGICCPGLNCGVLGSSLFLTKLKTCKLSWKPSFVFKKPGSESTKTSIMLRSSADGWWKVGVSLVCNFLVRIALVLCCQLVRRLLFFYLDGIVGAFIWSSEDQFGPHSMRQRYELGLTLLISKSLVWERVKPPFLFVKIYFLYYIFNNSCWHWSVLTLILFGLFVSNILLS